MFRPNPAGQSGVISLYIVITVCYLDNHGVDLDPLSRVSGAIILLDRARLELRGLDNPLKIWSECTIVGDQESGIGAIMFSSIGVEHCSGIPISLIRI
jgi:hypothetical protein